MGRRAQLEFVPRLEDLMTKKAIGLYSCLQKVWMPIKKLINNAIIQVWKKFLRKLMKDLLQAKLQQLQEDFNDILGE